MSPIGTALRNRMILEWLKTLDVAERVRAQVRVADHLRMPPLEMSDDLNEPEELDALWLLYRAPIREWERAHFTLLDSYDS